MAIEFNTEFYLQSKFNQLEAEGLLEEFGVTSVEELATYFAENGVDAKEHYLNYGVSEGINPSAEFDTNAYLEAKLAELQDVEKYGDTYADYTVEDVIAAFQGAGLTPLAHFNAYGADEGLEATPVDGDAGAPSELTEALETYQAAVTAERAFLEAATENEAVLAVDDESTNAEIELAIGNAVNATVGSTGVQGTVVGELEDLASVLTGSAATTINAYAASFAGASATVKAEIIAEAQAEAAKEVQSAQDQVGKISGQLSKVNALVSAKAAYEAALEAAPKALTTLNAEINKFDTLNTAAAAATYTPADPSTTPATAVNYVVSDGTGDIIKLENGRLVVTTEGQSAEGIDALLAAARADFQAKLAVDATEQAYAQRLVSAITGEDTDSTAAVADGVTALETDLDTNASNSQALLDARELEAELAEAISDYQAIATVAADLAALQTDVEDAADAIEELGYELAEVTAGASAGTDADDLFVYGETELDISGFGLEGNDLLFIGEGFSEVRVETGDDAVSDRLGSSSELEIFFQQEGNNALIFVEQEAFGGNATNANDLVKITLAGVNIEDLQFENGYVSVVEVA